jgi:isoleucyl-tRNA synthetase
VARIFEKESADAWYKLEAEALLPAGASCRKCGSTRFRKEMDILDVWIDSGASSIAVLEPRGLPYPADVYLEGGDQFRGWFNSSLVVGLTVRDAAPYRAVITYGWAVDVQGEKLSKSKANVADEPEAVIRQSGAEILRLWCSALDYHEDMRVSDEILRRVSDAYRKIRNTARFCLGNLNDFDPVTDRVPIQELYEIDRWALAEINEVTRRVREAYDRYDFNNVYQMIYSFSTTELSAFYFDIIKDRLYTSAPQSQARRSAQTALHEIVSRLARLAAPILVFTADEIWEQIPRATESTASVHLSEFPSFEDDLLDEPLRARYARVLEIRGAVLKALEDARSAKLIGAALEAKVTIRTDAETRAFLAGFGESLRFLLIVSQVEVVEGPEPGVLVERAEGQKCERCWNYTTDVGDDVRYPGVCARCVASIDEMHGEE